MMTELLKAERRVLFVAAQRRTISYFSARTGLSSTAALPLRPILLFPPCLIPFLGLLRAAVLNSQLFCLTIFKTRAELFPPFVFSGVIFMTGSDNDVVLGKHLESLANAAKQYTLAELVLFEMTNDNTLDTIPASVNGGLWYELDSNAPVVKIFHDGNSYALADNLSVSDSTLSVDSGFEAALSSILGTEE